MSGRLRVLLLSCGAVSALALGGCTKLMEDMYDQPKYEPWESSSLWPDGAASRPLPPGTVPRSRGTLAGTSSGREGEQPPTPEPRPVRPIGPDGKYVGAQDETGNPDIPEHNPLPVTAKLLHRGQDRFNVYCSPCHSVVGDGDGMVVRRGFPPPPSFHTRRLRKAPDAHFYRVITHGYGVMFPYAARVAPDDRWAIIAYIRALQFSQNAPLSAVPEDRRFILDQKDAPQ